MNHLQSKSTLRNQYFVLRHGESTANQTGLIVSDPLNGVPDYGLSQTGREQVQNSVRSNTLINKVTQIISSDFRRAQESAQIASTLLGHKHTIVLNEHLRERFFGEYELRSNEHYQTVWDHDAVDSSHTINSVESADAVMMRVTSLVLSLEQIFKHEVILLVAHGDTLQILQAAFHSLPASQQRSLPHLETAEIRELVLTAQATHSNL